MKQEPSFDPPPNPLLDPVAAPAAPSETAAGSAPPSSSSPASPPQAAASASGPSSPTSPTSPNTIPLIAPVVSAEPLERVLQELIRDRRSERRWKSFFRLMWLGVAIALVWISTPTRGLHVAPAGPHTAMVDLRGELSAEGMASAELVISALRDAFANPNSRAVVLRINSPGGSPVQAGLINDEIVRLKDTHHKKLYAVVEEICASGAYYVAVSADEIYVDKASLVGSIGVLMEGFGFTGLMEKAGVERRLITAGENKGMLDPFMPQTTKEREHAQALIDQIHRQFISVVKQGRGDRLKASGETFSGLFWNGEEAVRMGLVDGLGSVDQVARDLVQAPDVVDYSPRENVAERLVKRFGASVGAGAMHALRAFGAGPGLSGHAGHGSPAGGLR